MSKIPTGKLKKQSMSLEEETKLMEDKLMALRVQMAEERKKREERKKENGTFWDAGKKGRISSASSVSSTTSSGTSSIRSNSASHQISSSNQISSFHQTTSSSVDSGCDPSLPTPTDKIMYSRPNKDMWRNPFSGSENVSRKTDSGTGTDPVDEPPPSLPPAVETATMDTQTDTSSPTYPLPVSSSSNKFHYSNSKHSVSSNSSKTFVVVNSSDSPKKEKTPSQLASDTAEKKMLESKPKPVRLTLYDRMMGERSIKELERDLQREVPHVSGSVKK